MYRFLIPILLVLASIGLNKQSDRSLKKYASPLGMAGVVLFVLSMVWERVSGIKRAYSRGGPLGALVQATVPVGY